MYFRYVIGGQVRVYVCVCGDLWCDHDALACKKDALHGLCVKWKQPVIFCFIYRIFKAWDGCATEVLRHLLEIWECLLLPLSLRWECTLSQLWNCWVLPGGSHSSSQNEDRVRNTLCGICTLVQRVSPLWDSWRVPRKLIFLHAFHLQVCVTGIRRRRRMQSLCYMQFCLKESDMLPHEITSTCPGREWHHSIFISFHVAWKL